MIHSYWLDQGIACRWVSELEGEEQDKEYYEPLKAVFDNVKSRREERLKMKEEARKGNNPDLF